MVWPTLRGFLRVPSELDGKGVRIAVVDGDFPSHPDITTNERRTAYMVRVMESKPQPRVFEAKPGPWAGGAHGLWAAAAAAGSGAESQGLYGGMAPEADLFLIAEYSSDQGWDAEQAHIRALEWVRSNWRKYEIRGVLVARKGRIDSGLLPWQTEPPRVLCEELAAEGVLVVAGSGNVPDLTAAVTHAAAPSVLSVGGIAIPPDGDPCRAEMFPGSRGTTFEGKQVPEILAPAENVVLPHGTDEEIENHFYGKIDNLPRRYARANGTSFSGPVILGAAACLWQAHPSWTAPEMKTALVVSSMKRSQWSDLRAGLVSVCDALAGEAAEAVPGLVTSPYREWSSWRKSAVEWRLDRLNGSDPEEARDAILSFMGDTLPHQAINPICRQVGHPIASVRAVALCALASVPSQMNADQVRGAFRDASASVRMAGVYSLRSCPDLWDECRVFLRNLFGDTSLDVRYEALRLAKELADPEFAEEIVSGLEDDARMGRVANFAARRDALEAITGEQLPLRPPFVHGQSPHADTVRQARVDLARRWEDWLGHDWLAGRE